MLEAFRRAVPKVSKRGAFFFHIAIVLVAVNAFRGDNWKAILVKPIMVAIAFLFLFFYESHKECRAMAGKPWLNSGQLWRRFYMVVAVLSVIYVGSSLSLAVFGGKPDALGILFPFYILCLVSCAVALYWEFKDLNDVEGDTSI